MSESKADWGHYAALLPYAIERIKKTAPVAYIPWGALEWHSYHAPVGLDCLKARGLCEALAREAGGIVLPPFYVGTDTIKPYKGFPHTLEYSEGVLAQLCTETMAQLVDEKFRVLVLITGHYSRRQQDVIRDTADAFAKAHPETGVWAFPDCDVLEDKYPPNHAALGETALQMLFDPGLVDLTRLPEDRVATLDEDGVWGEDPRKATVEAGRRMLAHFLEKAVPRVKALMEKHA